MPALSKSAPGRPRPFSVTVASKSIPIFKQWRSVTVYDASLSIHTTSFTSTKATTVDVYDSVHELAINAAQERKESLEELLPQSLLDCEHDCPAPFQRQEISLGPLLGTGEYANVYEIKSFRIQPDVDSDISVCRKEQTNRRFMKKAEMYRHTNKARYALKHLKESYLKEHSSRAYAQAAGDLAVEAKLLSSLCHPNVIKLRGMNHTGSEGFSEGHSGFFLVIDRLADTLDGKIKQWRDSRDFNQGQSRWGRKQRSFLERMKMKKSGSNLKADTGPSPELDKKAWEERLNIALQLSAALVYLHGHRIIYRDLKPDNIGFDVRGDVKVFDFGLARVMPRDGHAYNDKFEMSGAGSPRYMAPELLRFADYNLKADCYSFGIVLWQILSSETPYAFVRSKSQLTYHVVEENGRPNIDERWPRSLQGMLEASFDRNMDMRPKMTVFHEIVKKEIASLRGGDGRRLTNAYINRRRSNESFRLSDGDISTLRSSRLSSDGSALRGSRLSADGEPSHIRGSILSSDGELSSIRDQG